MQADLLQKEVELRELEEHDSVSNLSINLAGFVSQRLLNNFVVIFL